MNHATHLKVTPPFLRYWIEQLLMWRRFLLVAFALFSFAHSSTLRADDPSDTALGYNAFSSNISGTVDTAIGAAALNASTTGSYNTAIGDSAQHGNRG